MRNRLQNSFIPFIFVKDKAKNYEVTEFNYCTACSIPGFMFRRERK